MTATLALTRAQAETVLPALDDAAGARCEHAAATCQECATHPAGLCPGHEAPAREAHKHIISAALKGERR